MGHQPSPTITNHSPPIPAVRRCHGIVDEPTIVWILELCFQLVAEKEEFQKHKE